MANLPTYILGAIGEHQTLSRLLLLGYNAAITNLSVENTESTDILCRDSKGRFCAIQVKTTSEDNWKTGISHKEFYDDKGNIDLAKGRKFLENKVVGPWVFVQVGGTSIIPTFKFFVLSRSEVIDMIYSNEEWYLTGYNRKKPLKGTARFIYMLHGFMGRVFLLIVIILNGLTRFHLRVIYLKMPGIIYGLIKALHNRRRAIVNRD